MITSCIQAEVLVSYRGILSLKIIDGEGREKIYRDVSRDIEALNRFADAINHGGVSPIHIDELVEDFLGCAYFISDLKAIALPMIWIFSRSSPTKTRGS